MDVKAFFNQQKLVLTLGPIGLALLLWVFVVSENVYSVVTKMPIEGRNLPARKALKEEVPAYAQVKLKGAGRDLFKTLLLKRFVSEFKLVLDLERISEEYVFVLNDYFERYPQKVVISPTLEVEFVEVVYPDSVFISLDEYREKTVPVILNMEVSPASGFTMVGNPRIEPATVKIAGSREMVDFIQVVPTTADTLSDLTARITKLMMLELMSEKLLEYNPVQVTVNFDIQPISERILSDVPVTVMNLRPDVRVFPSPQTISLTVVGGADYIATLNPEDVKVSIDFTKRWSPDQTWYAPDISVPENVMEWMNLSPRNIELVVTRKTQ